MFYLFQSRFQNKTVGKYLNKIANKLNPSSNRKIAKPSNENNAKMFQDKSAEM